MIQYIVARGSIQIPRDSKRTFTTQRDFIVQGQVIPEGLLPEADLKRLLSAGKVSVLGAQSQPLLKSMPPRAGKWSVNPDTLKGKSMEELMEKILEIDEDFDFSKVTNEAEAVALLSSEFIPSLDIAVAPRVSDKADAPNFKERGPKDLGTREMAAGAQAALARAQAKAAGNLS